MSKTRNANYHALKHAAEFIKANFIRTHDRNLENIEVSFKYGGIWVDIAVETLDGDPVTTFFKGYTVKTFIDIPRNREVMETIFPKVHKFALEKGVDLNFKNGHALASMKIERLGKNLFDISHKFLMIRELYLILNKEHEHGG
jgi:hypothetical protein